MLNRGSVIVRPKQPYIDWAASLDDSGLLPRIDGEKTVYLIPEYESDEDAMDILSVCFGEIFEMELLAWHLIEGDWPKNRTFSMFKKWFSLELHSCVEDICGYELIDDGFEGNI